MKLAVDLRSLHGQHFSGVESYIVNLLERLLPADRQNEYTLFYNGLRDRNFDSLKFINSSYKQTHIPNRLLNLSLRTLKYPRLDKLVSGMDVLFMPNWNSVAVSDNVRTVVTVHDVSPLLMPEAYGLKPRIWHRFLGIKTLLKRADHLLAVSNYTKTSLVNHCGIPAEKITVTPLGVDTQTYNPEIPEETLRDVRNRYELPGKFILYLGTVEPRKNLGRIIDAFDRLNDDTHLVIAGKWGWKYQEVQDKIRKSRNRRNILPLGYVLEEDKPAIIKLAAALCWPSLYEGFGLPVLEAMAVGTPVITSHVASMPEVAGDAAILVDPYSTDAIVNAVRVITTDDSLREKLVRKGLERSADFSWDTTAKQTMNALNNLSK